ncbi:hypothetical protein SISNIDRAFT_225330 [Sistotremastrum niveocremeum HHB9708]|uniref:G-protein coupled receptors family 1 profile domain-containing protein n=1 Tax=Sistotremastrum niveocremeum HHB9708 TaxID=1314777 RepID=A0A164Q9L7_9AGAM|nr:hypothetical protein SISNIDRAFT_225330 [Sistotremastrum niveocremeum HHB9708]
MKIFSAMTLSDSLDNYMYSSHNAPLSAFDLPPGTDSLKLGTHPRETQLIWFSFIIATQLGELGLLLTFIFSKSVNPRGLALINLIFVAFLDTFVYLIPFYNGSYMDHIPPQIPCLIQAVLKHGLDMAFLLSAFLLVFETFRSLNQLDKLANANEPKAKASLLGTRLCILAPYLNGLAIAIPTAVIGVREPSMVKRVDWGFYCTVQNTPLGLIIQIEAALLSLGALICLGGIFLKIWRYLRQHDIDVRLLSLPKLIRVSIFTILELSMLLLSSGLFDKLPLLRSHVLAIGPIFIVIIFATQNDILQVWFPCFYTEKRKRRKASAEKPVEDDVRGATEQVSRSTLSPIVFYSGRDNSTHDTIASDDNVV